MTGATPDPEAIAEGVRRLRAGEPVAFPTETVYGLGADAFDPDAVARVFALKGRPPTNPVIVHVSTVEMAREVAGAWPESAGLAADRFWPGPLTLVLPRSARVPPVVTAGGATVGVRCPAHPIALALIEAFGHPLVGPSANPSGRVSPTRAEHVRAAFGARVFVIDGGPCARGIESTVLDLAADPPRVLRPGVVSHEALGAVLGRAVAGHGSGATPEPGGAERSPGRAGPHYRPSAPVVIVSDGAEAGAGDVLVELPEDADEAAAAVYGLLHDADARAPARIVVVLPAVPRGDAGVWAAVRERLGRAGERG